MTTRTYQTTKRNIRRSRRVARQTNPLANSLVTPVFGQGVFHNRISVAA